VERGSGQYFSAALLILAGALTGCRASPQHEPISISYPADGACFPRDIVAPIFRWQDANTVDVWRIRVELANGEAVVASAEVPRWRPGPEQWERIKESSISGPVAVVMSGLTGEAVVSQGRVNVRTSTDPVGAPIFFRQVPLPFSVAQKSRPKIHWRLGFASSREEPRTVLEGLYTCANCHSFSADGRTLAMDLDYSGDKGSYAIAEIGREVELGSAELITWRDYRREDGHRTFGLLSQVSPDGRYVISTVKEKTIMHFLPDPYVTQLFFPLRGILAVYDRLEDRFFALPGADDPDLVQTNPAWSPDGKWVVFARAEAHDFGPSLPDDESIVPRHLAEPFIDGRETFSYDLYRVSFNGGRGGEAEPLAGASNNSMSNYFARFSPDGRWIVYCRASGFMFNRPDSDLYIVPSDGGRPRRLGCNTADRMDSWHSFSPNGRWLVFSSKANGPFTQLWLTHIDEQGRDTSPILLEHFTPPDRAANLPEFVNIGPDRLHEIRVSQALQGEPEQGAP